MGPTFSALSWASEDAYPTPPDRRASVRACPVPFLRRLEWDSRHFGFAVAKITAPCLPLAQLSAALQWARRHGMHLVYWPASCKQKVPPSFLEYYAGLRADRQVTFQREFVTCGTESQHKSTPGIQIREYPKGAANAALVEFALTAGVCSRFRADLRIPAAKFASLYETWIQRSTRREIADVVLIASPVMAPQDVLGMVTLSVADETGQIGLLAVAASARRRGVGRALLEAANRWTRERGAIRNGVTTQLANRPACALYESAGYTMVDVTDFYHFWPQAALRAG